MNRVQRKLFSPDEKQLLVNFVKHNKIILENKANDTKMVKARKQKWEELGQIFAVKGYDRDWQRLREYYHRMKCNAKAIITSYKKYIKKTGNLPEQMPSEIDWAVYDICPDHFIDNEDSNDNESEVIHVKRDNSQDTHFFEEMNYDNENGFIKTETIIVEPILTEPTINEQRRQSSPIQEETSKKLKTHHFSNDNDQISHIELEILEQKKKFELELHIEKLEFAREKHRKDMENANLIYKKLKIELDTAAIAKIKMEKDAEKLDLELALLQRQLDNS